MEENWRTNIRNGTLSSHLLEKEIIKRLHREIIQQVHASSTGLRTFRQLVDHYHLKSGQPGAIDNIIPYIRASVEVVIIFSLWRRSYEWINSDDYFGIENARQQIEFQIYRDISAATESFTDVYANGDYKAKTTGVVLKKKDSGAQRDQIFYHLVQIHNRLGIADNKFMNCKESEWNQLRRECWEKLIPMLDPKKHLLLAEICAMIICDSPYK